LSHNVSQPAPPGFPKCVFWKPSSKGDGYWSSDGCNVTWISSNQTICNCSHLTNFAVLLDVYGGNRVISPLHEFILRVLTYVGCGLSIAGLFITLLSYVIFGKIRRDAPAKILICLCISLIAVNLFYLGLSPAYFYSPSSCVVVSVLLHYFLLSSLTWMGLEALNMYIALIRVFNTYYRKYILKISLAGWGIPLIVVLISLLLHFFKQPVYVPIDDYKICWIQNQVFYGCLVAPFAIIFTFNCIIFCLVLAQLLGLGSRKLKHRDSRRFRKKSA
uniref:G-protein coupled receptors family 2 profile 2 domain-containing protein n=1 Tax=Ciona savignyi TaxID=51511 RepID=H2YNE2_CIOSA